MFVGEIGFYAYKDVHTEIQGLQIEKTKWMGYCMWAHARRSRVTEMRKNRSLVGGFVVIGVGGSELITMHAAAVV